MMVFASMYKKPPSRRFRTSERVAFYFYFLLCLFYQARLSAQCLKGNCENGEGSYKFASGATFEGIFRHGQIYYGTYTYTNKDVYKGYFENHKKHGQGEQKYSSGDFFTGEYREGNLFKGVLKYKNGAVYEGRFKNNTLHGKGKFISANKNISEGYWENGKFIGKKTPVYYIVAVGIEDYKNFPKQGDLKYAVKDATLFIQYLKIQHSETTHITLLTNAQATKENILSNLKEVFTEAQEDDIIIFIFQGMAIKMFFSPIMFKRACFPLIYCIRKSKKYIVRQMPSKKY